MPSSRPPPPGSENRSMPHEPSVEEMVNTLSAMIEEARNLAAALRQKMGLSEDGKD